MVANAIDITDWRRTQDALAASERVLRELNSKLIDAQEEERKRVARELHDDISQAIAMVSIELSQLAESATSQELRAKIARIGDEVRQVALEVSQISHSLHPAKLQYLGIGKALQGLCRDVSNAHKLQIECRWENNSVRLSEEAELCMFRIAQEALRNMVKHSKASRAVVEFKATEEGACLTVRDEGVGFDVAKESEGLGLVSMRRTHKIHRRQRGGPFTTKLWHNHCRANAPDILNLPDKRPRRRVALNRFGFSRRTGYQRGNFLESIEARKVPQVRKCFLNLGLGFLCHATSIRITVFQTQPNFTPAGIAISGSRLTETDRASNCLLAARCAHFYFSAQALSKRRSRLSWPR